MDGEFESYDHGWRMGIFDKCNGRERKLREEHDDTTNNDIWFCGYEDAYNSHERMI